MKLTESIKMAFASIKSSKMRSFLTSLGIIIGVFAVTMLVSIIQGTTNSITSRISSMGTNLLTANIRTQRNLHLSIEDLEKLQGTGGIDLISPIVMSSQTTQNGSKSLESTTIQGVLPGYATIRNLTITSGRFISQADIDSRSSVCIVGVKVCDELFGTRDVLGEQINVNGHYFTIVGILKETGTTATGSSDNQAIIPFTTAQRLFQSTIIRTIYVSAENEDSVTTAKSTLEAYLLDLTGNSNNFSVSSQTELLSNFSSIISTLTMVLGGIAGISLIVGGIGIMNIMLVSVTERTREIGIRKAIGAQRSDILLQFLIEAVVLSLLGGIVGILLSVFGLAIVAKIAAMTLSLSVGVALLAIIFSIAVGVGFGVYPANKASKLLPIEALRYE